MEYLMIAGGLVLLLVGGDALVRGAVDIATRLGLSPMLIGLTLVGFGTSTPELLTSVNAALQGAPGISIGNVVGSNIANILLILGAAAVISPLVADIGAMRRDGLIMIGASVLMIVSITGGDLTRVTGLMFVGGLIGFITFAYWAETRRMATVDEPADQPAANKVRLPIAIVVATGGLLGVMLGADLLVKGSITVATALGISDTIIGLTIVAVGTSLPELATSVIAAVKKNADIAIGNVIGSNIYNILGILGVTALIKPIPVPAQILQLDGWVMLAVAVGFVALVISQGRVGRLAGITFLAAYGAYIVGMATFFS